MIQGSVYRIQVEIANNMHLYKGRIKYDDGAAFCKYKYQMAFELQMPKPIPNAPLVLEDTSELLKLFEELNNQVGFVAKQLKDQEEEFTEMLERKEDETRELLTQILERVKKAEPRKFPRFARPLASKPRPAFAIEASMAYERFDPNVLAGFPIPSLDSPAKPPDMAHAETPGDNSPVIRPAPQEGRSDWPPGKRVQAPGNETSERLPPAEKRVPLSSIERPIPRPDQAIQERTPLAPTNQNSAVGKCSIQCPPSTERDRPGNPEQSFFLDDLSMESKTLFGMLGLRNTRSNQVK
jgi:hypothetical protein